MMPFYYAIVTVHVLAALLWLGGMFFLAVVGAPVLRSIDSPALRQELFRRLGAQFRTVGWASIAVLVTTGALSLQARGFLRLEVLTSADFWSTTWGRRLAWKLALVAIMLSIQAVHDFVHGPGASRLEPGSPEALRMRRWASWMARLNALLGVVVVHVAVRLARGG
jgi:putative copper resistance protein D